MTYFVIICSTKKFQTNFEVSEVLITYVTNRGEARVMFHKRASHNNNCQITLNPIWTGLFANLKRLEGILLPLPPPPPNLAI